MARTRTICCRCPIPGRPSHRTVERVRTVQDYLEIPVAVENVSSYAAFTGSQMTEWEFLTEVVERADCGILLDVNNIYVSAMNHEFNPLDYVNAVPAHRVAQIHIAGHSKYEKYILDTHDHPVIDPVWQLYARAIERCGADTHAFGVGRPHSQLRRGPHRSEEGRALPAPAGARACGS